ncbi:hypothetical protein [Paraburkholderia sp. LEh10]|uniref:hypothetical protein n=1 Tax=Paraburkholderia sp. LEh10 TaxID=2821353 RepID=UPI0028A65A02|nr:hypothetical protein [Paraburkholderia sp. LEh10]
MIGHVAEIAGHDPETAGHVHPKYALSDVVEMIAEWGLSLLQYDEPALREALYARVRQTLEPLCYTCGSLVACRRD